MKNAIIYYFTGSGNTLKAVNLYKSEFDKLGFSVKTENICDGLKPISSPINYDYVGIAYPVHGFNAPLPILKFAKHLPKTSASHNYFIIRTSGEPLVLNNVSSYKLNKIMKDKGYVLTNEYGYVMPYNMIFRHDDGMASLMYQTMKKLVPLNVTEIVNGIYSVPKRIFGGSLISALFRIEHVPMPLNGRLFKVDYNKCINCGLCEKNCSLKNITIKDGKILFGKTCTMCTACSFNCPQNAISIGILNKWKVNGKYDFNALPNRQSGKHANYCKISYDRYFEQSNIKIVSANLQNDSDGV